MHICTHMPTRTPTRAQVFTQEHGHERVLEKEEQQKAGRFKAVCGGLPHIKLCLAAVS